MFEIRQDDLSSERVRALLALHLAGMQDTSPPGSVFALDISGLQLPEVTVWSVSLNNDVAAIGALKDLSGGIGEIKSMRTHPDYLRKGAGAALLEHIIDEARRRGMRRLSLETGSGAAFKAALNLYHKHGFVEGEAFAAYSKTEFCQFLHREL